MKPKPFTEPDPNHTLHSAYFHASIRSAVGNCQAALDTLETVLKARTKQKRKLWAEDTEAYIRDVLRFTRNLAAIHNIEPDVPETCREADYFEV